MLVNSERFGSELASTFSKSGPAGRYHNVVLMRNHGFTTIGTNIEQAVYRAVCTCVNANVQSNVFTLRNAQRSSVDRSEPVQISGELSYLDQEQTEGYMQMNDSSKDRKWSLWEREVEVCPLCVNTAKKPSSLHRLSSPTYELLFIHILAFRFMPSFSVACSDGFTFVPTSAFIEIWVEQNSLR